MNATITITGNSSNIIEDYSEQDAAHDAAHDARRNLKVWVVVNEDGAEMTGLMTGPEADKFIIDMSMDVRPNAYKGWMSVVEKDVEVFTAEQEKLFTELLEACENLHSAEMSKALRGCGTPMWRVGQMEETITAAKARYSRAMGKIIEAGDDTGRAFCRWRKLNK